MKRIEQKPYLHNDEVLVLNLFNEAIKHIVEAKKIILNTPYIENAFVADDDIKLNKLSKKTNQAKKLLTKINSKLKALDSKDNNISQIFITHLKSKIIGSDVSRYENPIDKGHNLRSLIMKMLNTKHNSYQGLYIGNLAGEYGYICCTYQEMILTQKNVSKSYKSLLISSKLIDIWGTI